MITPELLKKFQEGRCSIIERTFVQSWYDSFENNAVFYADEQSREALNWKERSKLELDQLIKHLIKISG